MYLAMASTFGIVVLGLHHLSFFFQHGDGRHPLHPWVASICAYPPALHVVLYSQTGLLQKKLFEAR